MNNDTVPYSFELLSCSIRVSEDIKGIQASNKEVKSSQYAEDTTSFYKDEISLSC